MTSRGGADAGQDLLIGGAAGLQQLWDEDAGQRKMLVNDGVGPETRNRATGTTHGACYVPCTKPDTSRRLGISTYEGTIDTSERIVKRENHDTGPRESHFKTSYMDGLDPQPNHDRALKSNLAGRVRTHKEHEERWRAWQRQEFFRAQEVSIVTAASSIMPAGQRGTKGLRQQYVGGKRIAIFGVDVPKPQHDILAEAPWVQAQYRISPPMADHVGPYNSDLQWHGRETEHSKAYGDQTGRVAGCSARRHAVDVPAPPSGTWSNNNRAAPSTARSSRPSGCVGSVGDCIADPNVRSGDSCVEGRTIDQLAVEPLWDAVLGSNRGSAAPSIARSVIPPGALSSVAAYSPVGQQSSVPASSIAAQDICGASITASMQQSRNRRGQPLSSAASSILSF